MLKRVALPVAVRLFSTPVFRAIPSALEIVGCSLQSKRGGGFDAEWQEITNALQFIRRKDPVIFDVGANLGHWTTGMLNRLNTDDTQPKIIMFEPQSQCWQALHNVVRTNVELNKTAVGSRNGILKFYQGMNSELGSVYERSDFSGVSDKIDVPCITLDSFIEDRDIRFIDYIKMDIEGNEMQAIMGARKSLENNIIQSISFEFGSANVNSRTFFVDFFELFRGLNFVIYRMGHDGVPIYINKYSRSLEYFNGVANYVAAVHPPKRFRPL
jgi:FkbM family methyltransferase